MKMKGVFIGLLMLTFLSIFVGAGEVGATNCYYLYYNETCSNYDWENWDYITIAMHRDTTWETAGYLIQGTWNVFGNAIHLKTGAVTATPVPDFFSDFPLLAGVKKGQAKLVANPYESKANISQAQGFFKVFDLPVGCWYLKKVKNDQCPWIME